MSFHYKQGYLYSENGWRMCDISECDTMLIPGTSLRLPFRSGAANDIMRAWLSWFNHNVESLNNPGRGFTDEGSFTNSNDVGNSNHNSGTAADLNWSEHNFRVSYSGFNSVEIAKTRQGLSLFTYKGQQVVWWGQDWNSPKDPMHFQLNLSESNSINREFADKLLDGYLGIYSGTPSNPVVVVPVDYGDDTDLQYGSTGNAVSVLQNGMNHLFPRYKAMPLVVDGDFGPNTAAAVKEFQSRSGLDVDGVVGPATKAELKKYGIKV